MSLRQVDIAKKLSAWLDRYAVPVHLRDKPEAASAEADSLARILCKFAPSDEYQPFLNRVFDTLDGQMKHRVWPTGQELGAACVNQRKEHPVSSPGEMKTPAQIIAGRMARGEAVGEGWLYGISAVELIVERLVDEPTMTAYRSGAFLSRREVYGEASALAWESETKARHAAAKDMYRGRNSERKFRGGIPDKRVNA